MTTAPAQTQDAAPETQESPVFEGDAQSQIARIPLHGMQAIWYKVQLFFKVEQPTMKLNAADKRYYDDLEAEAEREADAAREAEAARQAQAVLEERFTELGKRINHLVKIDKVHLVMAVNNQFGGGSKTWFSNLFACEFADTTRMNPLVIEGRRNAAVGMKTLGVDRDATVSSRELYALLPTIHSGNDLVGVLSSNEYGVMGLKTDKKTPTGDTFTGEQAGEVVDQTSSHLPAVVIDLGNNPTDDINIGMCEKASVGAHVTIPSEESIELCVATVTTNEDNGLEHLSKFGFYMVNMMQPGMKPEDFREQLEAPKHAKVLGTYYDRVTDTTWSAHSASHPVNKVVRLDNLQLITRVAMREAIVTALELQQQADACDVQQHRSIPTQTTSVVS